MNIKIYKKIRRYKELSKMDRSITHKENKALFAQCVRASYIFNEVNQ